MHLSEHLIADYAFNALSALSNCVNIDKNISAGGILVKSLSDNEYEVSIPKKEPEKRIGISYYRSRLKPALQNAIDFIRFEQECEFQNLQIQINAEYESVLLQYSNPDCIYFNNEIWFNYCYTKLCFEYMGYASAHFHFLYGLLIGGFKDLGAYVSLHIVVGELPRIRF